MRPKLNDLLLGDAGQDLVEYALLASLLAAVSVAGLNLLGPAINDFYQRLVDVVPNR